ncbi:hypothetical protein [Streptomyces canus]|uniref:hypothetical protein n=1 Tax=Streptomyces canus TaxID=58343 RepID=UPI002E270442
MYDTPEELREFLALCLDPGPGRAKRTPEALTRLLPEPTLDQLARFDPNLGALRSYVDQRQRQADTARLMWAAQLAAWITGETPGEVPAATSPAEEGDRCAHESWEVTSEYRDHATGLWVQSRRCADCPESLPTVTRPRPHFPQRRDGATACTAAAKRLGHAAVEETATAYVAAVPEAEQPTHDEERPALPSALPWLSALRGEEFGNLLGEMALAMHHGKTPRGDESTEDRHARTVRMIDGVLAGWRDAMEHRRPTSYLTRDGRVWTYAGEHRAQDGPALYESPTCPKPYSVDELKGMYGWVAAIEGAAPADGEMVTTTFEDYGHTCRAEGLVPAATVLVRSGSLEDTVHAAVHVSVDPRLELDSGAVDAVRTAIADGLAFRGE